MLKSVILGLLVGGGAYMLYRQVSAATVPAVGVAAAMGRTVYTTGGEVLTLREDDSGAIYDNVGRVWL